MKPDTTGIPAVMYHSVGRQISDWHWSFLTVPWRVFESQLQALSRWGYRTIGIGELVDHLTGERPLSGRNVLLTFDDGYLDNWVYVVPLLEKYSFRGTVFVNTDFVDPREVERPTLSDVWRGAIEEKDLHVRGFMSWPELRRAGEKGVLDVQCHAKTHTWYEVSDEIIDFHRPDDEYYWLRWNFRPEAKPFYLENPTSSSVPYGHPVYAHGKSLAVRRYIPDQQEIDGIVQFAAGLGDRDVLFAKDYFGKLQEFVRSWRDRHGCRGRFETEQEHRDRITEELVSSKEIISWRLGKTVEYLCWPGGGYSEAVRQVAGNEYRAMTLASSDTLEHRNRTGDREDRIRRIGVPYVQLGDRHLSYCGGAYFIFQLEEFRGSRIARKLRQFLKLLALAKLAVKSGRLWRRIGI